MKVKDRVIDILRKHTEGEYTDLWYETVSMELLDILGIDWRKDYY